MINEQINKAIAKACEWNNKPVVRTNGRGSVWVTEWPDYCADLNAMHEAEAKLSLEKLYKLEAHLKQMAGAVCFRATARQRAEAFLKTLGKWEEVQG